MRSHLCYGDSLVSLDFSGPFNLEIDSFVTQGLYNCMTMQTMETELTCGFEGLFAKNHRTIQYLYHS